MGVKVTMLDALAHVFQRPLKQKSHQHEDSGQFGGPKRFRNEVQEAHTYDEGAPKGQDVPQVAHPSLTQQDKGSSAQEGGDQEDECRQEHGVRFKEIKGVGPTSKSWVNHWTNGPSHSLPKGLVF